MKVDYLNFDYDNKEKVREMLTAIHSEINNFLENPIIGYVDIYSSGLSTYLASTNSRIFKTTNIKEDNTIDEKNPTNPTKANPPGHITQLQNTLKIIEQHIKPLHPEMEIFGIKKYKESKKEEKEYDDLAKKDASFAKQKLEEVKSYIAFSLAVLSDLEREKNNTNIFTEHSQEKLDEKMRSINAQIMEIRAITENLEDIRYKLEKIRQDLLDFRGLQDDEPRNIVNEFSVQHDVLFAKSLIDKFKQKLTPKEKRQNIFDSCESKYTLQSDGEIIDSLLSKLRAERDKDHNNKEILESIKLSSFIEKVHNGALSTSGVSMRQFVSEERMGNIYASFFGYSDYSLNEQISRLELLKLTVISTQQELQDYLTAGDKEITITRTADNKLNITIGHKLSLEEETRLKGANTTIEKSFLNNKSEITYSFDLYKKELDLVTYKDSASLYELDINSELGKNIKNQFTSFLAALEGSLNIEQKSLLGFRVSLPQNISLLFKSTGLKDKFEVKGEKITAKLEAGATLGEVGWTKRRGPKVKATDITAKASLETKEASLDLKVNTYLDENLDMTTKAFVQDFVLSFQKEKISAGIGTQLNPIAGIEYCFDNETAGVQTSEINQKGLFQELSSGAKGIFDTLTALFYARVLNDTDKACEILGTENVDDIKIMSIFEKCKDYFKQIKYARKDAQTYLNEDIKKEFHLQNQNGKIPSEKPKKSEIAEQIINKIGKPKDVKIDSFTSSSEIKGADKLSEKVRKDNGIKTTHERLLAILDTKVLIEDEKTIRDLLLKVANPLIYFDKFDRFQAETNETRINVKKMFDVKCEDYIKKLIKEKNINKLKEIINEPKYREVTRDALRHSDKNDSGYVLLQLKKETNESLDDIISSMKKSVRNFVEENKTKNEQTER